MIAQPFAIMRTERITSWSHAYWVGQHNAREMATPNADTASPKPIHEIGSGDARADLMAAHDRFKPKRRADGVLGLEFVFTASPEAFDAVSASRRVRLALAILGEARGYLEERYPHMGQIASLVLHLDERTPHVHAVVIPVHRRVDRRGGEREYYRDDQGKRRWRVKDADARRPQWMLSADRDMGGKAQLAIHQTAWATRVEYLGLRRGRHRSGAAHTTNKEHVAALDAAIAAATMDRDGLVRERTAVAEEADRQQDVAAALNVMTQALADERAAHADHVRQQEAELARHRAALAQGQRDLEDAREKARAWQVKARARAAELDGLERQERAIAKREREADAAHAALDERSEAIADLADAARIALSLIDTRLLPPELRPRIVRAAHDFGVAFDDAARVDRVVRSVTKGPIATPARAI